MKMVFQCFLDRNTAQARRYVASIKAEYRPHLASDFICLFSSLPFDIMVLLQHSCYLITFILTKTQASLSSHQQDAIRSLYPGSALIQERDPIDFTHFEPVDFLAAKSDSDTPSDENPSELTFDQTQLEGDNFVPSQSTLISALAPVAEPNKQPVDNSQDSALLPWDENGGVPLLIPNLPSLSLPSFPNANQDSENKIKEGIRPEKEPDCDDKLFSFCCESGPPILKVNSGTSAERIEEIDTERKQRLRGCAKCLSIPRVLCYFSLALHLLVIGSL